MTDDLVPEEREGLAHAVAERIRELADKLEKRPAMLSTEERRAAADSLRVYARILERGSWP